MSGTCCTSEFLCLEGEGDCDDDGDCAGSLVCGTDNCGSPFQDTHDCCYEETGCDAASFTASGCAEGTNCLLDNGRMSGTCCTSEFLCLEGEGDCDDDGDCADSLVCGTDNCGSPFQDTHDCCMTPPAEATSHYVALGNPVNADIDGDAFYCADNEDVDALFEWNSITTHRVGCCTDDSSAGFRPDKIASPSCEGVAATYSDAVQMCADHDSRLCTLQEMLSGATKGKGCSYDSAYHWVSTECTDP